MRKALLLISLLAIAGTTLAYTASMDSIKTSAAPDSPARFQIEVQNNGSEPQRYKLGHKFSKSGWVYYESYKNIQPSNSTKFNITVTPGKEAIQNSYNINFYVTEQSSGVVKGFSDVLEVERQNLINVKDVQYSKTEFNPGESVEISITLQNLASEILSDYRIKSSLEGAVRETVGDPFAPGALKTYSFNYVIPEDAAPGNRTVGTSLSFRDNFQNFSNEIRIKEIRNITRTTSEINKGLYIRGEVRIKNNGNDKRELVENMTFPTYIDPILSFNHRPSEVSDDDSKRTYIWKTEVGPGDQFKLTYEVNYWMPLLLAISIVLGLFLLRKLTGNVRITKEVEEIDGNKRKVSLEIKNHSSNSKEIIEVEDFIPNVMSLDEDFKMTEPDIKKTTDGIKLKWGLEDFKPGESRVITYKTKEKVKVEGGVDLPPAKIVEDGKKVSSSN